MSNADKKIKMMTDAYYKIHDANLFKLFKILAVLDDELIHDIRKTYESMDISSCEGQMLDDIGAFLGQPRGRAEDELYRIMLRAKISRNMNTGDANSVIRSLALTFNSQPNTIKIRDHDTNPSMAVVESLPLEGLAYTGITINESLEMIRKLVPAGVQIEVQHFYGTFRYSKDINQIESGENGYSNAEQTTGGYYGVLLQSNNII